MEYEERFGVKVDTRIPEQVRTRFLYSQWEAWRRGIKDYSTFERSNLLTRYEHFGIGSGVGLPPDPFKPLALQHESADFKAVIEARRQEFPPGKEYRAWLYTVRIDFEAITGLDGLDYSLGAIYPEINDDGRIPIPKIVAVYDSADNKVHFGDDVITRLQLPTSSDDFELDGVLVREVFDFGGGYRIEFVGLSTK